MHSERFSDQYLLVKHEPGHIEGKLRRKGIKRRKKTCAPTLNADIIGEAIENGVFPIHDTVSTVNSYVQWLADKGVGYEIRVSQYGILLVKGITLPRKSQ